MTDSAPPPAAPDDPVELAWQEVERDWGSPEAHQRFLALCSALNSLPTASRLYREVRDRDPNRKAEAERRLSAILAQAMSQLDLSRSPRPTRKSRIVWVGYGLSVFFVVYTLLSILRSNPP